MERERKNGSMLTVTSPVRQPEASEVQNRREALGIIIDGSLSRGLVMRLAADKSVEDLRAGEFVVVEGQKNRFFAILGDIELAAIHKDILLNPPQPEERLRRAVLAGTSAYGLVHLRPMVLFPIDEAGADASGCEDELLPVRTVPAHFSAVYEATQEDVSRVFGIEEEGEPYFCVGTPLDMDAQVCINMDRWIERSNAIFGKSGTGKTFLTRLCLCGAIRARKAVHLIFDMHNEYGWEGRSETAQGKKVRGLKQIFGSQVVIATLDSTSSKIRGVRPDFEVKIGYDQVEVDDILLLQDELNLNEAARETCYLLEKIYNKDWLRKLLELDLSAIKELCAEYNIHSGALSALQRKLTSLERDCKGFLVPKLPPGEDPVQRILSELQRGHDVVLEFGRHDKPRQYMLVANILTRRLHDLYVEQTEKALGGEGSEPHHLIVVIEEAHKFLSPLLANQTIFGTIAREMRKYHMTLLIVDQRPSQIDRETLSQVGTRICCLLDEESDMDAALTGIMGASDLRTVLASLETRQQALIFGHAVPMPVVIRTRTYDDAFIQAMTFPGTSSRQNKDADFERERDRDF
ncbi:predicted ATPase [Chthonomonas calidirosea]|uniref:helicase HerA domain-containing protein n=1 Tax=Chthonomonas calidirosea TaxID=454171 RepID=UPI0006DD4B1E|nr:ATP-binding protein [Chthonomonas calidirosea]CEK13778.1 predicted ATPase [Chthonomonas calidirosea]